MAQTIEREKQKIREEIAQFVTLEEAVEKKRYKIPHLTDFRMFLRDCRNALEKDLSGNLERIAAGYPTAEQSGRLADFRSMVKRLRELMFNFLLSSFEVPRELYFLSDLFLEYNETCAKYIICVSDEIATLPLTYILRQLGLHEMYPEFWEKMKGHKFYFVQTTSQLKDRRFAIDWPIILHELAHIVCQEHKMEDKYFPTISSVEALEVIDLFYRGVLPPNPPLVELSTKKLYVTEHLADFLVTRCFGATFVWRFLEGQVDLIDIFEPGRTHPPPDKRIELMLSETGSKLNMPESSALLRKRFKTLLEDMQNQIDERVKELDTDAISRGVDAALQMLCVHIRKRYKHAFTTESIRERISESAWFKILSQGKNRREMEQKIDKSRLPAFIKKLGSDLRKGTPIIVDPPTLYYISMVEFLTNSKRSLTSGEIITDEQFGELLANSIGLYAIYRLFCS